ncbi:F-box/FBD/LRR-repeat protein At1g78750-like [Chenopodium quinoa]|uniref:F-box/FBD/LRR-repeat protein At1g78750-like n=1 Tax=Chenopodium quinoa TaxID=63459 RepID=UPI000B78E50C|nr:F-box/FBD/LRR-repeat protein At1g78750-like [Chenopodium quinoa]
MEKKFYLENESDRISELPEFIKTHILSYLDTKDAVRTSILSRCWRALPTWLLDLDLSSYYLSTALTNEYLSDLYDDASKMRRESIIRMREGFYAFLDRVFESSLEVDNVKLYVPGFGFDLKSRLDHWLDGAVRRRVKELELEIGVRECPRYSFPESGLVANSITKLKLRKCEVKFLSVMDNLLPSLQELCLEDVCLNSMALESLLGNCIYLKNVTLMNCDGLRTLEISSLTKLEKVTFGHSVLTTVYVESIKVDAPNLLEFRYIYDGDSIGNTCQIEIVDCKIMKHLELNGCHLHDKDLNFLLENFPLLEELFLQNCDNLVDVDVYCQNLVRLAFDNCRELVKIRVSTPNLKFFTYMGEDPIPFVYKGPALKLTDACLRLKSVLKNEYWFVGLIKLLEKLSDSETLTIEVASEEDIIIPGWLRIKSRPTLYAVKNLLIAFQLSRLKSPVEVFDSLLWLAPCPESISISDGDFSASKSIKFLYERPLKGKKNGGRWKSSNCWQHSLKKVWIENQGRAKDDMKLVNFFEKGRIGGKVECIIKNLKPEY